MMTIYQLELWSRCQVYYDTRYTCHKLPPVYHQDIPRNTKLSLVHELPFNLYQSRHSRFREYVVIVAPEATACTMEQKGAYYAVVNAQVHRMVGAIREGTRNTPHL